MHKMILKLAGFFCDAVLLQKTLRRIFFITMFNIWFDNRACSPLFIIQIKAFRMFQSDHSLAEMSQNN